MKKLFLITTIIVFSLVNLPSFANDIDGEYRKQILNSGLTYNTSGLFNAIRRNDTKNVKLFLLAGMNPDATLEGTPAVMYALFIKKMEIFDILLDAGANVETDVPPLFVATKSQNLMSFAIKRKYTAAVESLIKHNVDVNKTFNNITPLNYAIKTNQIDIVKLLLNANAIPDQKTEELIIKSKNQDMKKLFND